MSRSLSILVLAAVLALASAASAASATSDPAVLARFPLHFEQNGGRYDAAARFVARGAGWQLFVQREGSVLALRGASGRAALFTRFDGAQAEPAGVDPLATRVHYLLGNDPSRWSSDNATFARVVQRELWPGIDLVYRGAGRELEYDFVLSAGADPASIRMRFEGARSISIGARGELVLATELGDLIQRAPVAYQEGPGGRAVVPSAFRLLGPDAVGFEVGAYDRSRELVIDPVLSWASYIGGSGFETINDLRVGADGTIYVGGSTDTAPDMPVTPGAFQPTSTDDNEGFAAAISADGSTLLWCTYLGGDEATSSDGINALDLDAAGRVIVAGATSAPDFPTTAGSFQPGDPSAGGNTNAGFVAALSADGASLAWGTYLGSTSSGDVVYALEVGPAGGIHVAGRARNASFPTTPGAFQTTMAVAFGGFVAVLAPDGSALAWSTLLASTSASGSSWDSVYDIDVDGLGRTWFAGCSTATATFPVTPDAFQLLPGSTGGSGGDLIAGRVSADGSALEYATYLGGNGQEHWTNGVPGVAADGSGRMWIAGTSSSTNYPVTPGAVQPVKSSSNDGVVTCIDTNLPGAAGLSWSTYYGGGSQEWLSDVETDGSGRAFVTGAVGSGLPMTKPWDACGGSTSNLDSLLAIFDATGALIGSTYFGGNGYEGVGDTAANGLRGGLRLDAAGNVVLFGNAGSPGLATAGAYQTAITPPSPGEPSSDAFLAVFTLADPVAASTTVRLPCFGSVPAGSLFAVTTPAIATTFTAGVDDPLGQSGITPGGALAAWSWSIAPFAGFPCGLPMPGWGPGGGLGEILIGIAPSELFLTKVKVWSGPGLPALHSVAIPCSTSLHGTQLYTQGALLKGGATVLTNALDVTIGS